MYHGTHLTGRIQELLVEKYPGTIPHCNIHCMHPVPLRANVGLKVFSTGTKLWLQLQLLLVNAGCLDTGCGEWGDDSGREGLQCQVRLEWGVKRQMPNVWCDREGGSSKGASRSHPGAFPPAGTIANDEIDSMEAAVLERRASQAHTPFKSLYPDRGSRSRR